ncbi:nucleotide sugar dehydrogenase [Kurthia huakuii]|uniref:nucleotide sugar dehydrogenase n=1 Tax=Kurthia huakuii TaxID=1421019 RepID=UPI0004BB07A3|nr:nucleotide sugar dehydrogenase [Kurthia huakuii]MBM7699187.1 UDP-N-acetyl-D-galactosamine dehydrogenase [Kurthia huakuii]
MQHTIAVVGLGYVGLPLAVELSHVYNVVGFDIQHEKIALYKEGIDPTKEIGDEKLQASRVQFTSELQHLTACNIFIVTVPTPIHVDKTPNLEPLVSACELIGKNLTIGDIVIFESTVYPGTTEEICVPLLAQHSSLTFGKDFAVAYSPERINPGDKNNDLRNILKIVSASDDATLAVVRELYSSIIDAGLHVAPSIRVAEAAKVIENAQRDINIAFMNELSIIFNKMNIDTNEVLEAAGTKWNFLPFTPGLVGGHCIGVDPYYFLYKAEVLGCQSKIISAGRQVNDGLAHYIVENFTKQFFSNYSQQEARKVGVLGITFKENCPDTRNSKVIDIIVELQQYGFDLQIYDPYADAQEVVREYGIELCSFDELQTLDALIIAVKHDVFLDAFPLETLASHFSENSHLIFDLKNLYNRRELEAQGYDVWNL